jgi:hypothetical protein
MAALTKLTLALIVGAISSLRYDSDFNFPDPTDREGTVYQSEPARVGALPYTPYLAKRTKEDTGPDVLLMPFVPMTSGMRGAWRFAYARYPALPQSGGRMMSHQYAWCLDERLLPTEESRSHAASKTVRDRAMGRPGLSPVSDSPVLHASSAGFQFYWLRLTCFRRGA